jgi:hypothetical protein
MPELDHIQPQPSPQGCTWCGAGDNEEQGKVHFHVVGDARARYHDGCARTAREEIQRGMWSGEDPDDWEEEYDDPR